MKKYLFVRFYILLLLAEKEIIVVHKMSVKFIPRLLHFNGTKRNSENSKGARLKFVVKHARIDDAKLSRNSDMSLVGSSPCRNPVVRKELRT